MPSALEFSTLLFSYIIYIGSIVMVLLIAISMFMSLDRVFDDLMMFIEDNEPNIIITAAIIVGIYLAIKVETTILEDVKFRSRMFNPQVIDLMSEGKKISFETLKKMDEGKTGALIIAAAKMGAVLGGATGAILGAQSEQRAPQPLYFWGQDGRCYLQDPDGEVMRVSRSYCR